MSHEGQRTPEQALTSKSAKGKEVDPLERGLEFLTICGSSSSKVCGISSKYCYFSLSLPLLKVQVPHEEPKPRAECARQPEGSRKSKEARSPQTDYTPEEPLSQEDEALSSPLRTVRHLRRTFFA